MLGPPNETVASANAYAMRVVRPPGRELPVLRRYRSVGGRGLPGPDKAMMSAPQVAAAAVTTSTAFCPPNPNELLIALAIGISRGAPATTSMSMSGP